MKGYNPFCKILGRMSKQLTPATANPVLSFLLSELRSENSKMMSTSFRGCSRLASIKSKAITISHARNACAINSLKIGKLSHKNRVE